MLLPTRTHDVPLEQVNPEVMGLWKDMIAAGLVEAGPTGLDTLLAWCGERTRDEAGNLTTFGQQIVDGVSPYKEFWEVVEAHNKAFHAKHELPHTPRAP